MNVYRFLVLPCTVQLILARPAPFTVYPSVWLFPEAHALEWF